MAERELEFKLRVGYTADVWLKALVPIAVLTVGFLLIFPHGFDAVGTRQYWEHMLHDPQSSVVVVSIPCLLIYMRLRFRYERLYVGPAALRYASPYGGPFRLLDSLQPSWELPWSGLKAELRVQSLGLGKRRYSLVLSTASGERSVEWPLSWQRVPFMPGSSVPPPRRDETEMRRAIMQSPLVQALKNRGVEVTERPGLVRPQGPIKGYDIAQDKRLRIAAVALIGLLLYFLADTFFIWPYMALEKVPVWPYLVAAPAGLWIGLDLGSKAPRMERTLISVMLAGSLCAATYPLMLRFNALTAPAGDDLYSYIQVKNGYFKPPEAGLPYIYFDNEPSYWSSFRNGSNHEFRVVKGALGFYELDTGRVQEETRAWWSTQKFR